MFVACTLSYVSPAFYGKAMRKKNNKDLRSMSKMELEVRRQKAATARKTSQVCV